MEDPWPKLYLGLNVQPEIVFSADQLIIQKQKLDFSITKPCRYHRFSIKSGYYIVPSPSTALYDIYFCAIFRYEMSNIFPISNCEKMGENPQTCISLIYDITFHMCSYQESNKGLHALAKVI